MRRAHAGEVVANTTRMRASRGDRAQHMPHVRFLGPDMREHTLVSRKGALLAFVEALAHAAYSAA